MKKRSVRAETPMAFVRAMLLGYDKYGVDPSACLASIGLSARDVRSEKRISAAQLETLSSFAMRELDDETFGWFERRLPWGSYGMLCRASLGAPSLRIALLRWCRHHALLTRGVTLRLELGRTEARLSIDEHRALGPMREFCLVSSLRYVHGYACWLVDSQLTLTEAAFPYAAPPHERVYPYLFPGQITFDAERASIAFDARYLDLAPRRDEAAIDRMLQNALPLTVRQYRRDRLLVEQVKAALLDGHQTASQLARALHVSQRTLHRHLQAEGASLQELKDDVRRKRSIELLQRTELPIKQIARMTGFESEKSFSRAFHEWTKKTPSEIRRKRVPPEAGTEQV